jgi:hypothetical protein
LFECGIISFYVIIFIPLFGQILYFTIDSLVNSNTLDLSSFLLFFILSVGIGVPVLLPLLIVNTGLFFWVTRVRATQIN